MSDLRRIGEVEWELPVTGEMRVPGRVFADAELMDAIGDDGSLEQLRNVATLPGVVDAVLAMPDVHQGYGFPVGGVAATELPDGVVSPGGVGFDVNCGVRLLAAPFTIDELGGRREALVHEISRAVPAGTGRGSGLRLSGSQLDHVLADGPRALGEEIAGPEDVELTESEGRLDGADPAAVSDRGRERGSDQLGTLGSGNHFLEVQRVDRIHDDAAAGALGLHDGGVTVLIHSGSRGLGHQVCTDFVKRFAGALDRHRIHLPDRQLACAPASSDEGRSYLAAMAAAANFAWANRQLLAHRVREAITQVLGQEAAAGTRQIYDVAHNVAKIERHGDRDLCVHRKGATRAFPPGCPYSSPAAWERRATCWPAAPARWSGRSEPSATGPAGGSAARRRESGSRAASCGASSSSRASRSAHRRTAAWRRRPRSPTRRWRRWSRWWSGRAWRSGWPGSDRSAS
jgi:tRNA-splicing ligase RtcB